MEHRPLACGSRQLARNTVANVARMTTCVRQAAERYRLAACAPPDTALANQKLRTKALRLMRIFFALIFALAASALAQNARHPFTFEDMMKLKRVGAPVPSPDGKWVVFDCVDVDLEANTKISHLWIVPANGRRIAAIESNAESRGAAALFAGRQTR